jgi:O-antigen/teichoic acid export membrane protein
MDVNVLNKRPIARNTLWNFFGMAAPVLVALFTIPLIIKGLGTDRFGLLALAWVVMGYFGLFDFGLGLATTRFVAEYVETKKIGALPGLIWTSATFHAGLGLLGGFALWLLTPWLTADVLKIPAQLVAEAEISFYLLAASVPLIVLTAAFRGVLEALHRFDLVNQVKIPASTVNYLAPLLVLLFTKNLAAVVAVIIISRGVVFLVYFFLCLRQLPDLKSRYTFQTEFLKPLVKFGGWLTITNMLNPVIVSLDRFLIGALVSVSAVSYYATPYEVVTKLWIFSASLLAALFPVFSAMSANRRSEIRGLSRRAVYYLLAAVVPIVGVLLATADELLFLWVGPDFAAHSAQVARWLAIGTLINVLAQVPFAVLLGLGRADVTAKLLAVQMPLYAAAVWFFATRFGIAGVAFAWDARCAVDAALLFFAADRLLPAPEQIIKDHQPVSKLIVVALFLAGFWLVSLVNILILKIMFTIICLSLLLFWEWVYLLCESDRETLLGFFRPARNNLK